MAKGCLFHVLMVLNQYREDLLESKDTEIEQSPTFT